MQWFIRTLASNDKRRMMQAKLLTYLFLGIFLIISTGTALAQSGSEAEEDSPFKNDPFFSSPLKELLKKPSDSLSEDSSTDKQDDFRRYFVQLNERGIDYKGALEAGPYKSSALYSAYPNLPMIHFNRVNSLFLGLRQERMQWYPDFDLFGIESIHPHGMLGYSFGQKEWQYTVGLEKLIGRRKHVMLGAEYHNATTTDDQWRVGLTETTLTSFASGYDFLDYYKQRGWGTYLILRTKRLFEGGVAYSNDSYTSLEKSTDFALFGSGNRYRFNPPVEMINGVPVDKADISNLTFSASFNPKQLVLSRYFTLTLNAVWEKAGSGISESEYSYDKYFGELISYINFEPGGVFKYRLKTGGITGQAPHFKRFDLGGVGSLRALPYKSMGAANEMILSNAEIQFGRPHHRKSREWIDFDNFYLSLFLDSGWTNYNDELENDKGPFTGFDEFKFADLKHNAGIGIGSSLIRCELAWDLDNTSRVPVFWIRLNPTF